MKKKQPLTPQQALNNLKMLLELSSDNAESYIRNVREIATVCIDLGIQGDDLHPAASTTQKAVLADIESRKRADAKDRKAALDEGKRNRRYRLLLKLAGQGRSYEQIAKLTGMTPQKAKRELAKAAEWWVEARKHIDENLEQAMNPPLENN